MEAVLDEMLLDIALPDGTIVTRRNDTDDGEDKEVGRGYAHFNNANHTASVYLDYPLDGTAPNG